MGVSYNGGELTKPSPARFPHLQIGDNNSISPKAAVTYKWPQT